MIFPNIQYSLILLHVYLSHAFAGGNVLILSALGEVGRGNFTYWSLNYVGNLIVVLKSITGDADIYVSSSTNRPSYEPDEYDLHAATCGDDVIEIPAGFQRPIAVGIYGHPFHESSTFLIEVYYDMTRTDDIVRYFEQNTNKEIEQKTNRTVSSKLRTFMMSSGLWAVLELIELLLL